MGSGMFGDIFRQLDDLGRRLGRIETVERPLMGAGAAFPSSPATGARWWHTGYNLWAYYDGARWLTADEYEVALSTNATALITTAPTLIAVTALPNSTISITQATITYYVAATNNATNYWPLRVADDAGTIYDTNTSAGAADTWTRLQTALAITRTTPVHVELTAPAAKTGAPGGLYVGAVLRYRIVLP